MSFRICFVCTGNICRSAMAEYMLRAAAEDDGEDGVEVDSAGTTGWEVGNPMDRRARALLIERGFAPEELDRHRAREFERSWFRERDLILALDHDHYDELRALAPDDESRAKVHYLREYDPSVPPGGDLGIRDPWYGGPAEFDTAYRRIAAALPGVLAAAARADV